MLLYSNGCQVPIKGLPVYKKSGQKHNSENACGATHQAHRLRIFISVWDLWLEVESMPGLRATVLVPRFCCRGIWRSRRRQFAVNVLQTTSTFQAMSTQGPATNAGSKRSTTNRSFHLRILIRSFFLFLFFSFLYAPATVEL